MALPPRLWIPDGTHDLPTASLGAHGQSSRGSASGSTPAQRMRRRALWRGEASVPDRPVLVEWFPLAELPHERKAARRMRGLCHVHLLRLLDIGTADARSAYAVSEAPDGVDLHTVLRAAPGELPPFFCVAVAKAITRALLTIESHLSTGKRGKGGHGRVNLGTVFVGWDGSVRLLAFSPPGPLGGGGRFEDNIAPELRLSDRLLTSAADVYALGALLRELLPQAALRRASVQRLLRRCLHTQAEQRIALSTLDLALEALLLELAAPLGRAQAIGEVLGRCCPRATTDLVDADWGEHTGDGYPALPPTLAPLSASTVLLSPAWLRPQPTEKARRRDLLGNLLLPAALGILSLGALYLWSQKTPAPTTPPTPTTPIAASIEFAPPPSVSESPLPGLRVSIEGLSREPELLTLRLRLVNFGPQPIAPDLASLRLSLASLPELALEPLSPPSIIVGTGRVQEVLLVFSSKLDPAQKLSRGDLRLRRLPSRDLVGMPK